ncbi:hypothetical protein LINPERHAP2_LOCUS30131 [Linum perenne]
MLNGRNMLISTWVYSTSTIP